MKKHSAVPVVNTVQFQWFTILYLTNEQGYILGSAISMSFMVFTLIS